MHYRNNRGLAPKTQPLPTLEEFTRRCQNTFGTSYGSWYLASKEMNDAGIGFFVEALVAEKELYEIAWQGGDPYMAAMAHVIESVKQTWMSERSGAEKLLMLFADSQGDDFKSFLEDIAGFDWYFSFSVDVNAWRSGNQRQEELLQKAKTNPLWQKFYDLKAQQVADNIRKPKK